MIYDRCLSIYSAEPGVAPTKESMNLLTLHLYGARTVSARRFYESVQARVQIDLLLEIPGWFEYDADEYVIPADGRIYRLTQAEKRTDENGLPVMWLSLSLESRTWADTITLITPPDEIKANGYLKDPTAETERTVQCSVVSGVDGVDTYSGDKDVLRRTATVEVWLADYGRERKARFRGATYEIESAAVTQGFTVRLQMREELR